MMVGRKQRIGAMTKKQSTDDYLLSLRKKKKCLSEKLVDYLSYIQSEDCGKKHQQEDCEECEDD